MKKSLPAFGMFSGKTLRSIIFLFSSALFSASSYAQLGFTQDVNNGCGPLTVNFTNTSSLPANYFLWTFGDGDTANTVNASHVYSTPGFYSPYLQGWDTTGGGMNYQGTIYGQQVSVQGSSGAFYFSTGNTACPGEEISFYTNDQHNFLSWDFGDGSQQQNWNWTRHSFSDTGLFFVTLYIQTSCDSDTIVQSITITNTAIPSFNISANQNTVCPNDAVFFSAQNNYQAASYFWNFGDGNNSTLGQPNHSFADTGTYSVILTAINVCGNQNSDTLDIIVQNGVSPSTSANIWQNPTCPYSAASFQSNGSGTSYLWNFGDNATATVRNTQHFYTDTGSYAVEFIIANGCGNSDTADFIVSIQYNPTNKPNAQINFDGFWNEDTITVCPGEEVNFGNNTGSNSGSPLSYIWYFGDGDSSFSKDPAHTYSLPDTFSIQLIASNICGGKDTAFLWVISSNSAMPNSSLDVFPPQEMPICPGEILIFSDNTEKSIDETGYVYSIWYGDGDSLMNITSYSDTGLRFISTHSYQSTGVYQYTFEVSNVCGNTNSFLDTIVVNNPLNPFVVFAGNSAEPSPGNEGPCPGEEVQFYAISGVSFEWDFGDGQSDTAQFPKHAYAGAGTYNASVIVSNGCSQTDTAFTTAEISISNEPNNWFNMDKTLVSVNDTVNFSYGGGNYGSAVSLNWDFGDGNFSAQQNPSHTYSAPGIFNVTMIATNGCGSATTQQTVSVVEPIADFSFAFSNNGCTPEMVQFTNLSLYADSFKWDFGDFSPPQFFEDPAHGYGWASTFMVTLTAYNFLTGDSDKTAKPITINQTPMPGWAWFWPDPNPVCPGDEVAFNSFMFPSPTSVKWNFGDGDSSSMFNPSHSYADTGNYTVTYIAYNSCGSDTTFQIIDVDSSANISAGFWGDPNPACPGQQVGFSNFSFPSPISSMWYFGDGDSATSINAAHAYADTGTYTVTLIAYSSCNSDTVTNSITIDSSLVPSVWAFTNQAISCPDDEIDFIAGGINLISFSWDFDDGFSSLQLNSSHSFDSIGTYNVVFTGTNTCGNSSTDTVIVTIINNAPPDASFGSLPASFCPGFSNICPGTDVSFTNYTLNSAGNEWDFGDGNSSSLENPLHAYADTGNYNVRLIATSSCGGKDTVIQCVRVSDDVIPSAWFCYNPFCFAAPVCFGTEVSFINWSNDTSDVFWDFGDGFTSTLGNPKHIFSDTGTYTVILQVTNNCGNVGYASQTIIVTNNVSPTANLWGFPVQACPGEDVNLNVFSQSTANFFWDFSDGDTMTSTETNIIHTFDTSGNYNVMMVVFNGCGSDTNYIDITIKPGTLADFSFDTVCFGDTTHFIDASTPTPDNWAWDYGDGNTSTSQNPSHLFSAAGIYTASLSASLNGCVGSISKNINVVDINLSMLFADASCNNSCDGFATVSSGGGIEPYSYLWSNGQTGSSATGLCAGNYSVTVTDASGCSDSISVTINEPTPISYATVVAELICFGTTDGSIDLQPVSPFYSYLWNTGDTTEDLLSLTGATYLVTITDTNSCTKTSSFLIEETTAFTYIMSNTDISCNGADDATAAVSVTGTTTPFSYSWSEGSTTSSIDSLPAGSYNVTVTDSNGCSLITFAVSVNEPTALTSSVATNNAVCNNICNGNAEVNPSGGTMPYSFLWSNSQTDSIATGLCAGMNYVTVTDGNGCIVVDSADISEPSALTFSKVMNDASCNSLCDGNANVNVSGGISPYTFLWSNSQTDSSATGLCAGTYYLTVTDAANCTKTDSILIGEPSILSVSIAGNNVNCNGENSGNALAVASGGTPSYSFLWSDASTFAMNDSLTAGTYSVTATDVNGCTDADTITISQPIVLTVLVTGNGVSCNGGNSGNATAIVSGGISPYTYLWNDASASAINDSLFAGTYYVTATDANGCSDADSVTISEPIVLSISVSGSDVSCNGGNNGSATITGNGGTLPYSFAWSDASVAATNDSLTAGIYYVTATDANGCLVDDSVTISEPPVLSVSVSGNNVDCFGNNSGSVTLIANGGTTPYSYLWSNGAGTQNLASLIAGTYYVTVSDANGCSALDSVTISEPFALSVSVSGINVKCNGADNGSASLTVSGGTTSYSYLWNTGSVTQNISALSPGTYYVTVTDANTCTEVDSITISEPPVLTVVASGNDVSCNGGNDGSATLSANGGTAPYSFLWSNGSTNATNDSITAGNYSVTVSDDKNCEAVDSISISDPLVLTASFSGNNVSCSGGDNGSAMLTISGGVSPYTYLWSDGSTSATNDSLVAGNYSVTVTDSNGCMLEDTVIISEPMAVSVSVSVNNVSCNGGNNGSATLSASGGTSPYSYLWSDTSSDATHDSLSAGNYSFTITDTNGCILEDTALISEPTVLSATVVVNGVSCNGGMNGSAILTANGGIPPYSYLWSNASTAAMNDSLSAGNYSVTVTDANGCTYGNTAIISEPIALAVSFSVNDVSCNGGNNGNITANASGGTFPYTYLWSDNSISATNDSLIAGTYFLTATDANGCLVIDSANISEPILISISTTSANPACGNSNGTITAFASGSSSGFTYLWSNGQNTATATGLSAGAFMVTATDSTGCFATSTVNLSNSGAPVLTAAKTNISCYGENDGSIDLSVSGGTTPYSVLWTNAAITEDLDSLAPGNYSVTVTDSMACVAVTNATINEPASLIASVFSTGISCFGICDATVGTFVSGGISPFTYLWNNGSVTPSMTGMCAGNYIVVVTDANGCTTTDSGNLSQPLTLFSAVTGNDASCNALCDGDATATGSGGTSPYTYFWTNGQSSSVSTGLCSGSYDVTITDFNGCTSVSSANISEPSLLSVSASGNDVSCYGGNDGNATAAASGGTSSFTYLWSNGATQAQISNLTVQIYSVTVTDGNACTASDTIIISEPLPLLASATSTDASCNSGNDGTANVIVSGGTLPYNYLWNNGQTSTNATGLMAGSYSVSATDLNGCVIATGAIINEPALIVISTVVENPACGVSDGKITASVSGGISPYLFLWNDSSTGNIISALAAGSYSLTVTDSNSCTQISTIGLSNMGAPSLSSVISDVLCNGGTDGAIDLAVSGGTSPYSYSWDNGQITEDIDSLSSGTYSVSVTDASACIAITNEIISEPAAIAINFIITDATCSGTCNGSISANVAGGVSPYSYLWNNGGTDSTIAGLCGGSMNYVTITDINGCLLVDSTSVSEPTTLTLSLSSANATCFSACNGSASVNISGGTSPYSYNWSNGDNTSNADSLCSGTYNVTGTDVNGCSATDIINISEPSAIVISVSSTDASCNGICDGSVSISATGGTSPYTYSGDGTNLCAGNYPVTVTDASGCTSLDTALLTEPTAINLTVSSADASCNGICDGSVSVSATGGTSPYTYAGNGTNLCAGNYPLTATDASGCSSADTALISEPAAITLAVSSADASCFGLCDGSVSVSATGGTSPYTYSGDGTNLCAGNYPLTATDASGCFVTDSAVISEPTAIILTVSSADASCNGICDGSVSISATGGTSPYTYSGNGTNLCAGNYPVTSTDANGCSATDTAVISEPDAITLTVSSTDASCFGLCDGSVSVSATGGTSPYTYSGNGTNLCAGNYPVNVTDANGCSTSDTAAIAEPSEITLSVSSDKDTVCNGESALLTVVAGGGSGAPYTYLWNTGAATDTLTVFPLTNTCYFVSASDANGCASEADSLCIDICVGISQISQLTTQTSIFPNPVRDEMNLKLVMATSEMVHIAMINTLGQKAILFDQKMEKGERLLNINTEGFATGVYYLEISFSEEKPQYLRFVKEN